MYCCYFDESGGPDYNKGDAFVLGATLVHDRDWLYTKNEFARLRSYFAKEHRLSKDVELKGTWLVRGEGDFKHLNMPFETRMEIYKAVMRFQGTIGTVRTFGVVIDKKKVHYRTTDVRFWAWQYALERLQSFGDERDESMLVLPDEGHTTFIRSVMRKMRSFHYVKAKYGTDTFSRRTTRIIEDPCERRSHESYFIQMADLNAYAAYRTRFPRSNFGDEAWNLLGESRIPEVNALSGGPRGIKVWPQDEKALQNRRAG